MDGNILAPLQWMADLPVLGWIVDLPMRATLFLYTWPLPVGGPDPGAVFLGLYVLFAAALVRRQRFISAFLLVVLPLAASWWLFAQLAD